MNPPPVTWFSAGLEHVPAGDEWMEPPLAERLQQMRYTKRRSEARLGRWAAKVAIAKTLGLPIEAATLANVQIRNAPDGAPEVTIGTQAFPGVIAMTDRADWAVCAVYRGEGRVGCDLEVIEPRSPAFVADYLTDLEQDRVFAAANPDLAANLIWSAKESALKVLRTGLRRDTRSVEIEYADPDGTTWMALRARDRSGPDFPGWWARFGDFVLTVATTERQPPPVALDDPPALSRAIPTHAWLREPSS